MMTIKRLTILCSALMLLMVSNISLAQDKPQKSITLDQALQMTMTNNPTLWAAQSHRDVAVHQKKAAWGLGAPKLSVGAEYTYMSQDIGALDFNPAKDAALTAVGSILGGLQIQLPAEVIHAIKSLDLSYTLQDQQFGLVGATLAVPIFTGGKLNAVNRAAKIKVESADNEYQAAEADLFTKVTERYWGLAMAQQVERLSEQLVDAMQLHANNAKELELTGIIAKTERLYADMALAQAKAQLTKSQGEIKTINTALGSTLDNLAEYQVTTPMFVNYELPTLEEFHSLTEENSHILEKVDLLERLSKEAVKIERANYYPTIAAMGAATLWNYNLSDQIPRWTVGAGLKWTLFNGLTREHKHAAAKAQVREVQGIKMQTKVDIRTLVEKLYYTAQNAQAEYQANSATIEFAKEYLAMKQEAFKEGLATSSDVVDAQLNLTKAQTQVMAAAYLFDTTLAKLMAVAGITDQYHNYQNNPNNKFIEIN